MRALTIVGALMIFAGCGSESGNPDAPPMPPVALPDADASSDAEMPSDDADTPAVADAARDPTSDAGVNSFDAGRPPESSLPGVPRPTDPGVISWKACTGSKLDCGTMRVPIDRAQPEAGTLKLAVIRQRARGARVGALLINPGGPGSSAVDYLGYFVDVASPMLLDHFDIVAFDPRGVGNSTRVDCHATLQQWIAADPSPDDENEWQALDRAAEKFAADCQLAHAALLPHLSTVDVARDMDAVREALGEQKLNYLGFSYGTAIGAHYAELFPDKVGAFVLDGALDLSLSSLALSLAQAKGFELSLAHYFEWCQGAATRCAWTQGMEPRAAFDALSSAIDTAPVPTSDRPLGPGELLVGVLATLYGGEDGWRALSASLAKVVAGDASRLMEYVDGYLERELDGSYTNREEANQAVNCTDRTQPSVADIRAAEASFRSAAPVFGLPSLTGSLICAHWPVPGVDRPVPKGRGAPPIIVIGAIADPATPYAWAVAMADALESGVLVTANVEGHTGYGRGDNCVDAAVHAFLLNGTVPSDGACARPKARLLTATSSPWRLPPPLAPRAKQAFRF